MREHKERSFPELEFEAAAWALHFWSREIFAEGMSPERHTYLERKAGRIKKGIAAGIGTGGQKGLPAEIICDEHCGSAQDVYDLYKELRGDNDGEKAVGVIREAQRSYNLTLPECKGVAASRPLWLVREDPSEKFYGKWDGVRLRLPVFATFHRRCTSHFVRHVEDIGTRALKEARTNWKEPSEEQLYLVAWFLIGARNPRTDRLALLKILLTLCISGYKALAVYHLAKAASETKDLKVELEFPSESIEIVCEALVKHNRRRTERLLLAEYETLKSYARTAHSNTQNTATSSTR